MAAASDFESVAVEHFGIADGATGVLEAALAGVAGVSGAVNANEDLIIGVHVLLLWKHVIAKRPEAHDPIDQAENLEECHFDFVV